MPLTRYQIRNEYGLADPELFKAADKDDPEALLEGVAMAGLVGLLRQLGDLAEFAAEVFHDLHEEVISMSARGHGLMVRVQQLEADVPLIEKSFLSQTSHTSFFTNAGVDWHPNLQSEQSLIARGDLPRFVMDSYEECRGPPRLFLLDKFDVAGAGACLKRYTDPSVFKVEPTYERSTIELQREKKVRKVKKKGPRWRNGGTPDIGPTSHSKLHQLFLEERINSCFNDPSRIVKLKKRQFNGCGIDSKNGKSYMEKFLETPSPEHKMICETSVAAPTLHLMSDNTNELGLKILDITMVSPASKSPGRVSTCSSCIAQEEVFKSPVTGDLSGQEVVKMPESNADNEIETTPDLHVMMVENHSEYDGEGKTEGSVDGYHSDGVISEVDSYMDALGTMESEMETDNEHRYKNFNLLKTEKQESGSDANPEHLKTQAQLSDSQSFATSGSDEGNSSFKRDRSSFSCSDSVSRSVDNLHYDSEGAANALPSIPKACMVDTEDMPCNLDDITPHESKADGLGVLDNTSVDEDRIPKLKKALGDSCFLDSIPSQPLLDSGSGPSSSLLVEPKLDQTPSIKHFNFGSQISKTETDLDHYEVTFPDVPLKTVDDVDRTSTSERHPISDREGGDINVMSESLLHPSNVLCLADENEAVQKVKDELLQREYQDDNTDKQALPDTESCSSVLLLTETSPAFIDDSLDDRYNAIASKHNDNIVTSEVKSGDLLPIVGFLQSQCLKDQLANVADDVPQVEAGSADTDVFYSKGKANNVVVTWKANDGHADAVLDEMKPHFPTNRVPEIHVNSQEFMTETVHPEGITVPDPAVSSHFNLTSPGDQDHEDFVNDNNVPFEKIEADDVVDSVNNSDVATEKDQADNVVDSVNSSDVATEKVEAVDVVVSVNCSDVTTEKVQADDVVVSVNCSDVTTEKVQADDVVTSTAIVGKTASVTDVTSKNLDHLSDEERLSMDKPPIGTFQAEDGFVCDPDPKLVNVVSEEVCTSLIGQSCTSANIHNDLLENHPGVKDLYPNQNGFKDTSEYSWEPVTENKVNQLEVASAPCNSKHESVSSYSDSGLIDGIHNIPIKAQGNSIIDGISIEPKSLDLRNLESESNTSHQRDLKVGIEFIPRPPLCLFPMETPKEPSSDMRPKHVEMELMQAEDVYNSSSFQQSIKVESPGLLDEKVEQLQCPDLLQQDRNSNYNACEETVQAELSLSQLPIHHPLGELNMTGRTMDTLQPALPYFAFLPEVPQVNVNEIPPLPPLPPMQWRLGKIQPAFPALPGKEDPHSLVLPSKDNKQPIGLEPSNAEILQPENPNFCFPAHEHDKSTHVSGHMVHNMVQISPSPLQLSMIINDNYQFSSATMDDKQSTSSFLTLPPIPKENLEHGHGCLTSDGEKVLAGLTIEDGTSKDDSGSSYGHSIQSLSNSSVEKDLKHDIPQHVSRDFEGEQRNSHVMMAPVSLVKDENFQHDLLNTEQEVASSSDTSFMPSASEFGRPNGNPTSKLLRPRSPLIDAVAAHDKSKLRKVSDRILPQIGPKVDERDSLLAQIRTKSFNLKPAVVTRPSVQGPKTNLNVAAILEKASAIRHAFAGSDEDDDTDSWGDSE